MRIIFLFLLHSIYDVTMVWPHKLCLVVSHNPNIQPTYVEVFTKPNVDPEAEKQYIFEKTGSSNM